MWLQQMVHAVLDADEKLAQTVLKEENAINELQIEIDDRVVHRWRCVVPIRRFWLVPPLPASPDVWSGWGDQAVNIAHSAKRASCITRA